ncbi:SDR family oxidoreductase [bacterium]|nr:SDR family oxidoreductase [bacterium]
MISFNKEQIYIVTGASSGIGEGTALLLNELGATVVGIARNEERLKAMRAKSKYPENMHLEIKDLTDDIEGLPKYVKELKNKYGKFSGMAYCAGISDVKPLQLLEYTEVDYMFKVNCFAPVFFCKGLLDRRNNIGKGTSVVAISSIVSKLNDKGMLAYSSTKAALTAAYRCMAAEVAQSGIRINTVSPSDIKTPMTMCFEAQSLREGREEKYPLGFGEIDDVANFAVFLLSDKTKWITRQDYIIDCGLV